MRMITVWISGGLQVLLPLSVRGSIFFLTSYFIHNAIIILS